MKKTILFILVIFVMGVFCYAQMSQRGATGTNDARYINVFNENDIFELDASGDVMPSASGAQAWAGVLTGAANISGLSLTASGGPLTLYSRNAAQIIALDPGVVGEFYYCNNCTTTMICGSTGTAVTQWAAVEDPTAACE